MRLNISIENKSCSELCKHRENTSRYLKVFQNMALITLLEGMWEWMCGGVHIVTLSEGMWECICGGVHIVTLSEGMWEWMFGGVHIYQSCRPSIALLYLDFSTVFYNSQKQESWGKNDQEYM